MDPNRPPTIAYVCLCRRSSAAKSVPYVIESERRSNGCAPGGRFLYDLFTLFQQFVYTEAKSKAGKIGSMWIDSNSFIDSSLLKHCSFILNVTVWYCFCINMYLILCNYVCLILISCSLTIINYFFLLFGLSEMDCFSSPAFCSSP